MRHIIIGAGAIGGAIGGRLSQAGHEVVLVARGAQHAALREQGLSLTTPQGTVRLRPAVVDRADAVELRPDDVLTLAVKSQHSMAALAQWARAPVAGGGVAGTRLPLVCAQNGVENERLALRLFRRVYGMCLVLPATFLTPGAIVVPCAPHTGSLLIGRYPAGVDETCHLIAADLAKSTFQVATAADVMRWKYGKLVENLANAVAAVCDQDELARSGDLVARAKAEAAAVLAAAGIAHASDDELAGLRQDVVKQPLPGLETGYGSTWQSLARGAGSIETDYLNGEIVLLGRAHGLPTPVNETLLRLAAERAQHGRGPGGMTVERLAELVDLDHPSDDRE